MYCEHFKLQVKPFSLIPDPTFLHFTPGHKMAYTMLEYGMLEQTGITVITGEIGSGKTTILKYLLNNTNHNTLTIGLLDNYLDPSLKMLHWFAFAFGLPHTQRDYVELFKDVHFFLANQYAAGKRVVLIIDEAQNLSEIALEELRLLTNVNSGQDFQIQIILVGQPQLLSILSSVNLTQFAQRITSEYHLAGLTWEDTREYINHRLKIAGSQYSIFDELAMSVIFYHSRGVPRLVNTLCDYCLVHAYANGAKYVDYETAINATKGRKIGGNSHNTICNGDAEALRLSVKARAGLDIATV